MRFDPERVLINARHATTDDLLDRVTVYRPGMEAEAIEIIEGELQDRGIYRDQIREHAEKRQREVISTSEGIAATCHFCHQPAVAEAWGWHWLSVMLWGKRRRIVPVFPRYLRYCEKHRPAKVAAKRRDVNAPPT
jgi:hypothetical protein